MKGSAKSLTTLYLRESVGFPCQPFSKAGKRKGADDDRALWPENLRVIDEIKPRWFVGENVTGITTMGLDMVLASLEDKGYQTEVFNIPASALGAWHRRERIWIIAYNSSYRPHEYEPSKGCDTNPLGTTVSKIVEPANTHSPGMEGLPRYEYTREEWENEAGRNGQSYNDGLSNRMDRIKALGNSICPQVAYEIFKAINEKV